MINYYLLTKPGIVFGNLLTFAAGFLLASRGSVDVWLFFETLIGIAFIIASACVFNNYIDRSRDQKMERTKNRPLVRGVITPQQAILFGTALLLLGNIILFYFANPLAAWVANFGFFVYVLIYSLWKAKTIYGTAIGSVAGAIPPLVGYCAVSNRLDTAALILFAMLVLWQMPHFFSIVIYRIKDYARVGIPVLPLEKGMLRTKVHMLVYIVAFILASVLLVVFDYAGFVYLTVVLLLGFAWLILCLKGFNSNNDQEWAKSMFYLSLFLITLVSLTIPFDTVQQPF